VRITTARIAVVTAITALVVFCAVQDRVTAAGVRRYLDAQRDAQAGLGRQVSIDEVMKPAVEESVRAGMSAGGAVLAAGAGCAMFVRRRSRRG
jgi:hypothetical protein